MIISLIQQLVQMIDSDIPIYDQLFQPFENAHFGTHVWGNPTCKIRLLYITAAFGGVGFYLVQLKPITDTCNVSNNLPQLMFISRPHLVSF